MSGINSSLFQNSSFGSGNQSFFADYASLKNGSYARLMKSYYGGGYSSAGSSVSGQRESRSSNVLDKILEERRNPKVSEETQKANESLTNDIANLKNSVSTLRNEKTYTDTENGASAKDKVASAVKDYVNQYNDVVSAAKKSTLSGKTANVAAMMRSTAENADKLKEMGITINSNGTLQLNEGKLKATDVSKVQELFSSKDIMSYGSTVMSRLQFAGAAAGATSANKTTDSSDDKTNTPGSAAAALKKDGELLASDQLFDKIRDKSGKYTYDVDKIFAAAKSFVGNYNDMLSAAKSSSNSGVLSNVSHIQEKTALNSAALKQFGISVDMNGKMQIDEDTFKKSDMSKVQKLFKDYGSSIASSASLVDYYMTTQANAASGYTATGAYNVQGSARYADYF
ncbi:MAG: hypothetical protein K2N01_05050 [Lachnospiraceae bacterium]|nr:hypothetical protein [Lachnospiraceae bacterium]